jgi:hypothetical protein
MDSASQPNSGYHLFGDLYLEDPSSNTFLTHKLEASPALLQGSSVSGTPRYAGFAAMIYETTSYTEINELD